MRQVIVSRLRAYAEWLTLQLIRGVVLAGAVGVGAASVRNVTAALETAAYGKPRPRLMQPSAGPLCGGSRLPSPCAQAAPEPHGFRQAASREDPVEVSEALPSDVDIEAAFRQRADAKTAPGRPPCAAPAPWSAPPPPQLSVSSAAPCSR